MNLFSNPYPGNPFGSSHSNGIFNASAGFSGTTAGVDYNAVVKYLYFTLQRDGGRAVYTENRAEAGAYAERDFMADDKTKIKAVVNAKGYGAFTESDFIDYSNPYDIESVFKVILYFEPVIFQGGFRVQGYRDDKEYYRMSPYLSAAWDILPWASLYADFKPRLMTPDYTEKLRVPFILPSKDALVPAQSANLRTGLNMSLFEVFADLYFSYYSVKNYAYLDTPAGENYFTFYNRDLDYTEAGITVETLKIRDFKVVAGYSYRNILGPGPVKITYFPAHSAEAAFIYEPDEWRFEAGLDTASDALGTLHETAGAYVALNLKASRRINDYFTIGGYVNNVLNNNYYLLYYYREKGLNLGLEAVIGF
ncbi:MAG TPA: hypothetical protein ENN43_08515 [bacterium]|nr:hypothetical protein [bacterium]